MPTRVSFGRFIRAKRDTLDWTQEELAQRALLSVGTITAIERDATNRSARTTDALAKAFTVTPAQLLAEFEQWSAPEPTGFEPLFRRATDRLSEDARWLATKFDTLSPRSQQIMLAVLLALTKTDQKSPD